MEVETVVVKVRKSKDYWLPSFWEICCANQERYLLMDASLLGKLQEGFHVRLTLDDNYSPLLITNAILLPPVRVAKAELDEFMELLTGE